MVSAMQMLQERSCQQMANEICIDSRLYWLVFKWERGMPGPVPWMGYLSVQLWALIFCCPMQWVSKLLKILSQCIDRNTTVKHSIKIQWKMYVAVSCVGHFATLDNPGSTLYALKMQMIWLHKIIKKNTSPAE